MSVLTRRTALAFTASGLSVALTTFAAPATAKNLAEVEDKIRAHLEALRAAGKLWDICSDIEEANDVPVPRVQVSKQLHGRNDDGTDNFTPIYAYTEWQIIESDRTHRETSLSLWGRTDEGRTRINAQHDERVNRRLADFRKQVADEAAANKASGLTAAQQLANAASTLVDDCLDGLLDHPFRNLAELGAVSTHLIKCVESGEEGCDKETLARLVYAVAGREMPEPEWRNG